MKFVCAHALVVGLAGCASASLETSGSLSSYDSPAPADGIVTHSKLRVDKTNVPSAKGVAIIPTSFSSEAAMAELTDKQRHVIAKAVDRSVCIDLSDRFDAVPPLNLPMAKARGF